MTNAVLIARNRNRLTKQAVDSMLANTRSPMNLTIVDDGSIVPQEIPDLPNVCGLRLAKPCGIVGRLKNLGIAWSEMQFGRGEWLYLSDNDVFYGHEWLERLIKTAEDSEHIGMKLLGGYRHPFHGVNATHTRCGSASWVVETDAVAGYSWLLRWYTWDANGPFDAHAEGVCKSEDYAFSRKVVNTGLRVGYIDPPVLTMCGLTNTEGKPAIGHEHFARVEGLIYE